MIPERDTCKNAHIGLKVLVSESFRSEQLNSTTFDVLKLRFTAMEN